MRLSEISDLIRGLPLLWAPAGAAIVFLVGLTGYLCVRRTNTKIPTEKKQETLRSFKAFMKASGIAALVLSALAVGVYLLLMLAVRNM